MKVKALRRISQGDKTYERGETLILSQEAATILIGRDAVEEVKETKTSAAGAAKSENKEV